MPIVLRANCAVWKWTCAIYATGIKHTVSYPQGLVWRDFLFYWLSTIAAGPAFLGSKSQTKHAKTKPILHPRELVSYCGEFPFYPIFPSLIVLFLVHLLISHQKRIFTEKPFILLVHQSRDSMQACYSWLVYDCCAAFLLAHLSLCLRTASLVNKHGLQK